MSLAKSPSLSTSSCNMRSSNLWRHSSDLFAIGPPSCFKHPGQPSVLPYFPISTWVILNSAPLCLCLGLCNLCVSNITPDFRCLCRSRVLVSREHRVHYCAGHSVRNRVFSAPCQQSKFLPVRQTLFGGAMASTLLPVRPGPH